MSPSSTADSTKSLVLIRGGNDIASAVAHRLFTAGYPVIILEAPQPLTVRRGMAYASAIYEGRVRLDGVTAEAAPTIDHTRALLASRRAIPVFASNDPSAITSFQARVIVDARLRKKERSNSRVSDAPLVIGLGPGFTAGVEAHLIIETNRGPNLGRIITEGEAEPYTGVPIEIAGHGEARYLYAPRAGIFRTSLDLGHRVEMGQVVGEVEGDSLAARVGGIIRGIIKDGLFVQAGAKLVDIDPRGDARSLSEISQKAWTIADAVLSAVRQFKKNAQ